MKKAVVLSILACVAGVAVIVGGLMWAHHEDTTTATVWCGSRVMHPGDVCASSKLPPGYTAGWKSNYDQKQAEANASAHSDASFKRIVSGVVGALLIVPGILILGAFLTGRASQRSRYKKYPYLREAMEAKRRSESEKA